MRDDSYQQLILSRFLETQTEQDFEPLFEELCPRLRRFFVIHGLTRTVCEELTQDVLFTVYRQIGTLRDPQLFYGWTYKIARNAMLQYLRREHSGGIELLEEPVAQPKLSSGNGPLEGQLEEWMSCLDPIGRQIILLRFVEECSYQEIVDALSLPLGTVKWKIFDAKAKLAQHLERQEIAKW